MKPSSAYLLFAALAVTAVSSPFAQAQGFLTPRGRAPDGWTRLEWPEKRQILFGQYAPTEAEKQAIVAAIPAWDEKPADPPKVLLFYRCQYPHTSIATGVYAFTQLAERTGAFDLTASDNPADISIENLAGYDALLLLHTTTYEKTIGPEGQSAVAAFMEQKRGLIGIHAAADASHGWPFGADVMGGVFRNHPWLPHGKWAIKLESPDHPLNAAFSGEGFWLGDEIYVYRPGSFSRKRSRVLLSLDMSKPQNRSGKGINERLKKGINPRGDYPIAWAHERKGGRVFYSNLGHAAGTFREPAVLRHYLDGILYAAGRLEADVTPSAELEETATAAAPERN